VTRLTVWALTAVAAVPQPSTAPTEGADMAFNPLDQRGIPVEEQIRNWSVLNVTPFDKHTVDPDTRRREILMTVEPTAPAPPRPA
jgi:hypothetical protein